MLNYNVISIKREDTYEWLLYKHYAHRIPSIMYAFGLFDMDKTLLGVCCYGMPPCHFNYGAGIFDNYKVDTYELVRLVINDNLPKNTCSYFISRTFKLLPKHCCLVSFADPNNNHHGYIYQATNWLYTGLSQKGGKDKQWIFNNREYHAKTITVNWMKSNFKKPYDSTKNMSWNWVNNGGTIEENDLQKFRYLFLIGDRNQKKEMLKKLKLKILPYPKGDNKRYDTSYKTTMQNRLF